jgi:site-specific DNA-methyltransferase (adenine-specific)
MVLPLHYTEWYESLMNILTNSIQLIDCSLGYKQISDASIDLILTDPPYGVTACPWDKKPDINQMWAEFNRIIKPNGAIVITATQPFATDVINANRKFFRYDLVWVKNTAVGFLNANRMPLRQHELILVFYKKLPQYHPQKVPGKRYVHKSSGRMSSVYNQVCVSSGESSERYPTSVLHFSKDTGPGKKHPTQKPKALFEWVIKSYSEKDCVVFDPYMGSGTTAVAAIATGRNYIGFEKEPEYYDLALHRIQTERKAQKDLFVA